MLEDAGLTDFLLERLQCTSHERDLEEWRRLVTEFKRPKQALRVGLVGKYIELQDAYISVKEALLHAGNAMDRDVEIEWISSEELERGREVGRLQAVDGIVVPGGFGYRGIEGKIVAARYAREHRKPYLGLCLGMQVMCIELARMAIGSDEPNSTEFDVTTRHPVIDLLPEQRSIEDLGGTMRLGVYPCRLVPGTLAWNAYQTDLIHERHRHRFEFNNAYREILSEVGLVFSGLSPDSRLVEIVELRGHPWMLGTQFHPEFKSRPNAPHPLFRSFLKAADAHRQERLRLKSMVAMPVGKDENGTERAGVPERA